MSARARARAPLAGLRPEGPGERAAAAAEVAAQLAEARTRTLALVADLEGESWRGPRLAIVNPPLWELGHVGWFQEWWCLRAGGAEPSVRADADRLYHSGEVPHAARWDLPLPSPEATRAYLAEVLGLVEARLRAPAVDAETLYFARLALYHEDMHAEALLYTRQTHAWPAPGWLAAAPDVRAPREPEPEDVAFPGGTLRLGAEPGAEPFVFDNERWAHPVEVAPFRLARHAVTEGAFARFVDDGGYRRRVLWSPEGWAWREQAGAQAPLHWERTPGGWARRVFDRLRPLEPGRAMLHVGWHEAQAWCAWAGRRLPREAEWEAAARAQPAGHPPSPARGARSRGALGAEQDGEGARAPTGLHHLGGNVWEWTADAFRPYPGFAPDPYADYSAPWFGDHKVLRGGCFATQPRLLRATWRNFYRPERRDVFAGFRTCAR